MAIDDYIKREHMEELTKKEVKNHPGLVERLQRSIKGDKSQDYYFGFLASCSYVFQVLYFNRRGESRHAIPTIEAFIRCVSKRLLDKNYKPVEFKHTVDFEPDEETIKAFASTFQTMDKKYIETIDDDFEGGKSIDFYKGMLTAADYSHRLATRENFLECANLFLTLTCYIANKIIVKTKYH